MGTCEQASIAAIENALRSDGARRNCIKNITSIIETFGCQGLFSMPGGQGNNHGSAFKAADLTKLTQENKKSKLSAQRLCGELYSGR
jgi:hypothetical protein